MTCLGRGSQEARGWFQHFGERPGRLTLKWLCSFLTTLNPSSVKDVLFSLSKLCSHLLTLFHDPAAMFEGMFEVLLLWLNRYYL